MSRLRRRSFRWNTVPRYPATVSSSYGIVAGLVPVDLLDLPLVQRQVGDAATLRDLGDHPAVLLRGLSRLGRRILAEHGKRQEPDRRVGLRAQPLDDAPEALLEPRRGRPGRQLLAPHHLVDRVTGQARAGVVRPDQHRDHIGRCRHDLVEPLQQVVGEVAVHAEVLCAHLARPMPRAEQARVVNAVLGAGDAVTHARNADRHLYSFSPGSRSGPRVPPAPVR